MDLRAIVAELSEDEEQLKELVHGALKSGVKVGGFKDLETRCKFLEEVGNITLALKEAIVEARIAEEAGDTQIAVCAYRIYADLSPEIRDSDPKIELNKHEERMDIFLKLAKYLVQIDDKEAAITYLQKGIISPQNTEEYTRLLHRFQFYTSILKVYSSVFKLASIYKKSADIVAELGLTQEAEKLYTHARIVSEKCYDDIKAKITNMSLDGTNAFHEVWHGVMCFSRLGGISGEGGRYCAEQFLERLPNEIIELSDMLDGVKATIYKLRDTFQQYFPDMVPRFDTTILNLPKRCRGHLIEDVKELKREFKQEKYKPK